MTKTERYEKALSLINNCCKRNELLIIANNIVGEGNVIEYISSYNMERDNNEDILEAINLIGVDVVKDFIAMELDREDTNGRLDQAYKAYYEATVN